jgi:hypothetical protein
MNRFILTFYLESMYNQQFEKTVTVIPKTNTTLFFDIDLYHQGNEMMEGTKYWIGTELVCRRI